MASNNEKKKTSEQKKESKELAVKTIKGAFGLTSREGVHLDLPKKKRQSIEGFLLYRPEGHNAEGWWLDPQVLIEKGLLSEEEVEEIKKVGEDHWHEVVSEVDFKRKLRSSRRSYLLYKAYLLGVLVDRNLDILTREEHYYNGKEMYATEYRSKQRAWRRTQLDAEEGRYIPRELKGVMHGSRWYRRD